MKKRSAFALASVLMMLALIAMVVSAMGSLGVSNMVVNASSTHGHRALYAAEGGLALALSALTYTTDQPAPSALLGSTDRYEIRYNTNGNAAPAVDGPTGLSIPPRSILVVATGWCCDDSSLRASRQVAAVVQRTQGQFQVGALARNVSLEYSNGTSPLRVPSWVRNLVPAIFRPLVPTTLTATFLGSGHPLMDAYDSGKVAGSPDYSPANMVQGYSEDLIATNLQSNASPTSKTIRVTDGSVNGRVKVGPGGNYNSMVESSGTGVIRGTGGALSHALSMPDIGVAPVRPEQTGPTTLPLGAPVTLDPGNYDHIAMLGGEVKLRSGTYVIKHIGALGGKISFDDPTGNVVIYCTENFDLAYSDTVFNSTKDPSRFKVYYQGTDEAQVVGGASAYCTLVATQASVLLVGTPGKGLFGAVAAAGALTVRGAGFHFDKKLQAPGNFAGPGRVVVLGKVRL